ncbi:MAG: hypothetical protein J2P15_16190, partial [Micromonosporaceae bacterium]|nr:hypothetical protein [Micromonosporaceae bacterium]
MKLINVAHPGDARSLDLGVTPKLGGWYVSPMPYRDGHHGRMAAGTAHSAVKRELLVRYLDACVPALVHGARRVSYAEAYPGTGSIEDSSALAALRVFAELGDLFAKRRLDLVLVEPDDRRRAALAQRLDAERAALGLPGTCRVQAS